MPYDIRPISELETTDFTLLDQQKETVRKSLDGQFFVISGENIGVYSEAQIDEIMLTTNWFTPNPID